MPLQQLPFAKYIEFTNSSLLSLSYDRWEAEAKWGWFVVVPLELVNEYITKIEKLHTCFKSQKKVAGREYRIPLPFFVVGCQQSVCSR